MLSTQFRFIWPRGFRGEDFLEIDQYKTRIAYIATTFVNKLGRNDQSLYRTFHRCLLIGFDSFGLVVPEEKIFFKIDQPETRISCGGHVC